MKLSEMYFDKITYSETLSESDYREVTKEELETYGEIIRKETIQLFWKENTPEYKLIDSELKEIAKKNNL